MDAVLSYKRKSLFLDEQKVGRLLIDLQVKIYEMLIQEHDLRLFSPAMIKSLTFDLAYILLRHRSWQNAPILSELTIDYLSSEFLVPRSLCTQLVETCLDLLHSHTPAELEWDADKYESEFLEHLFICSTFAKDDLELADDIGFGRNLTELLRAAMHLEKNSGPMDLFQFAPELAGKLHVIFCQIIDLQRECPWAIDLFQLKNLLQRDPLTRKNSLHIDFLKQLFCILQHCSWHGISTAELTKLLGPEGLSNQLAALIRCGLIFQEPRSHSKSPLNCLSAKSLQLTRTAFALKASQNEQLSLKGIPSDYQTALIELALSNPQKISLEPILTQFACLTPPALRGLIDHLRQSRKSETLLELFNNLLHTKPHPWIRVEICQALPLLDKPQFSREILSALAAHDLSPMVRQAARSSLMRQARLPTLTEAN